MAYNFIYIVLAYIQIINLIANNVPTAEAGYKLPKTLDEFGLRINSRLTIFVSYFITQTRSAFKNCIRVNAFP